MSQVTIENQGANSFLVFKLDLFDELDQIALGMMTNNKIPNIISVTFSQINTDKFLRYPISSTVTLKNYINGVLSKDRVLTIFESICKGLTIAEDYLLDPNYFLIHPDYIYIDSSTGEAKLVYLAIMNPENKVNFPQFFKSLITAIKMDTSEDCAYIGKIINHLNTTENFSVKELGSLISSLKDHSALTSQNNTMRNNSSYAQRNFQNGTGRTMNTANKEYKNSKYSNPIHDIKKAAEVKVTKEIEKVAKYTKQEERSSDIQTPPASSIPKPPSPKSFDFEIPGGGSISSMPNTKKEVSANESDSQDNMSLMYLLRNFNGENLKTYKTQQASAKESSEPKEKKNKKKDKKNKAQAFIPPEVTKIILTSQDQRYPYPIVMNKDKGQLTLGRSKKNDISLSGISDKISRVHCSIQYVNGNFLLVDEGSKFGTFVNGNNCPPKSSSIVLTNGSIVDLAGEIKFSVQLQ